MTLTVRRMALIVGALFLCLLLQANRIQVVKADDLNNRAGNTRSIIDSYGQQRGSILVGGAQVARSVDTGNPQAPLRAPLQPGRAVRPGHGLLLDRLRRHAASSGKRTRCSAATIRA